MTARFVGTATALSVATVLLIPATWMLIDPVHYGGPMNLPDFRPLLMLPVVLVALMVAIGLGTRVKAYRFLGTGLIAVAATGVLTIGARWASMPSEKELDDANNFPPDAEYVWLALGVVTLVGCSGLVIRRRGSPQLPS
jgi:hypothetical protein